MACVRSYQSCGATGSEQELCEGIPAAASYSHSSLRDLRFDRASSLGPDTLSLASGGEGRRIGGGQGRGHRTEQRRGCRRGGRNVQRQDGGRRGLARGSRRVLDGRRTFVSSAE